MRLIGLAESTRMTTAAGTEAAPATPIGEVDAYFQAVAAYRRRTGAAPNASQRAVLLQQVRQGYIDGQAAPIDHSRPAPDGFDREDDLDTAAFQLAEARFVNAASATAAAVAERLQRAERAAERMDGLTISEAAQLTGRSARSIRARVDRGTLRSWKGPDGKRRIPRSDLVHGGLIDEDQAPESNAQGRGSGTGANAADAAAADLSGFALALWEKAEQAVREAAEHRLLAQHTETRLSEAQDAAGRLEDALHEARVEAAVARHEADTLRQQLEALEAASTKNPAEEDDSPRRRWYRRRR
jgi:excisionase family DNA binding protein